MKHRHRLRDRALLAVCVLCLASCDGQAPTPPQTPSDTPLAIQDLRASLPATVSSRSSLLLQWTVPMDLETQGRQALYEIRFDTQALAGDAWLESAGLLVQMESGNAGETDSLVVGDLAPGRLYFFVIRRTNARGVSSDWSNIASHSTWNNPPAASFTAHWDGACASAGVTVDASASSDSEDATGDLLCRWDWNADGSWDTAWSPQKTAAHTYAMPGYYAVRLQVLDRGGATAEATQGPAGMLTITSSQRDVWEETLQCCEPGPRGTCLNWCSIGFPHWHEGLGRWNAWGLESFVAADSLFFKSSTVPPRYGIWGMHANIYFTACDSVRVRLLIEGPGHLEISGPAGVVYPWATDGTPPPSRSFETTIPTGSYHVEAQVDQPATIRVSLTSVSASVDEAADRNDLRLRASLRLPDRARTGSLPPKQPTPWRASGS